MLNKQSLWLEVLHRAIDAKNGVGVTGGELKVTKELYDFILFKFKTDTFRGFRLVCK